MKAAKNEVDLYIDGFAPDVQKRLQQIRKLVKKQVPAATELVSYKIPAFRLQKNFFYFAAFKQHIGIYPPLHDKKIKKELRPYSNDKGNLAFPHQEPLPLELIGRIALALAEQYCDTESLS